jgi:hypothetical protein
MNVGLNQPPKDFFLRPLFILSFYILIIYSIQLFSIIFDPPSSYYVVCTTSKVHEQGGMLPARCKGCFYRHNLGPWIQRQREAQPPQMESNSSILCPPELKA